MDAPLDLLMVLVVVTPAMLTLKVATVLPLVVVTVLPLVVVTVAAEAQPAQDSVAVKATQDIRDLQDPPTVLPAHPVAPQLAQLAPQEDPAVPRATVVPLAVATLAFPRDMVFNLTAATVALSAPPMAAIL